MNIFLLLSTTTAQKCALFFKKYGILSVSHMPTSPIVGFGKDGTLIGDNDS